MRVTVSWNQEMTEKAVSVDGAPDLPSLVSARSQSEIVKVFGRRRFVSIETTPTELSRLKDELGDRCLFALKPDVVPFK